MMEAYSIGEGLIDNPNMVKRASILSESNIVKGASIVDRFLKGAYKFIWAEDSYMVGGPVDNSHLTISKEISCDLSIQENIKERMRVFNILRFMQKTVCTENARGEYRYRLEGFPVG